MFQISRVSLVSFWIWMTRRNVSHVLQGPTPSVEACASRTGTTCLTVWSPRQNPSACLVEELASISVKHRTTAPQWTPKLTSQPPRKMTEMIAHGMWKNLVIPWNITCFCNKPNTCLNIYVDKVALQWYNWTEIGDTRHWTCDKIRIFLKFIIQNFWWRRPLPEVISYVFKGVIQI